MRTFTCLMADDRYSAPQLSFVMAADEGLAFEVARRRLQDNPHHRSVEMLEDDRLLFAQAKPAAFAA